MTDALQTKQRFLLKQLTMKINKLSKFMRSQGMAAREINIFFLDCIFEISQTVIKRAKKQSSDFSSETDEETNSDASDCVLEGVEVALQKVLLQKIGEGKKVEKILLEFVQRCFVQEQKLRNYLKSQQSHNSPSLAAQQTKFPTLDFQKIRHRIHKSKYHNYNNDLITKQTAFKFNQQPLQINQSSLREICSINDNDNFNSPHPHPRRIIDESERDLNEMRSLQKSLTESIRKTKLLRAMLEKQLAVGLREAIDEGEGEMGRIRQCDI